MRKISRLIAPLLALGILAVFLSAAKAEPPAKVAAQDPADSLAKDPLLAAPVDVSAAGVPLTDILPQMSESLSVHLAVYDPRIRDQRVTLILAHRPLHEVMSLIVKTISHNVPEAGLDGHRQYYWQRSKTPDKDGKYMYELLADSGAREAGQAELAHPFQEASRFLREMREVARLPSEKRQDYPNRLRPAFLAVIDDSPESQALKSLTNDQFLPTADPQCFRFPRDTAQ